MRVGRSHIALTQVGTGVAYVLRTKRRQIQQVRLLLKFPFYFTQLMNLADLHDRYDVLYSALSNAMTFYTPLNLLIKRGNKRFYLYPANSRKPVINQACPWARMANTPFLFQAAVESPKDDRNHYHLAVNT